MNFNLKIWRQRSNESEGRFVGYEIKDISKESSFLEMLDLLNEQLVVDGGDPVVFDHDCREGICGSCSLTINGLPHGPERMTTVCQLHMRSFKDGDTIVIEPWRAKPFPVVKDLMVDRDAFEQVVQAGGFITAPTGSAPEANNIQVPKPVADTAMDAAECIGCGACVAACKNASAMLFVGAKVSHLNAMPQGKAEKDRRVLRMVAKMDEEGFGNCSNYGECQAVCPKGISLDVISKINRDYTAASVKNFFSTVK